jgi:hypothetical protein
VLLPFRFQKENHPCTATRVRSSRTFLAEWDSGEEENGITCGGPATFLENWPTAQNARQGQKPSQTDSTRLFFRCYLL